MASNVIGIDGLIFEINIRRYPLDDESNFDEADVDITVYEQDINRKRTVVGSTDFYLEELRHNG